MPTICASWYGDYFHGRQTASGAIFDMHKISAAHPTLPFGTRLELTNPTTGQELVVSITDRGPYIDGRRLDLSWKAARLLGMEEQGVQTLYYRVLDN